jgi:hypothetical protein|tara:strand:- start:36 stop:467 length:432 start_codon:yes stop_codon:yes gene_type:complete
MKKKKKASTSEKADQFLAGLGTAGGAIGSPQLVGFGASDVQNQLISGNTDEYANIRMRQEEIKIGESAAMPPDLDASYLKLNLPGSPLPTNGLLAPRNIVAAEQTQDMILSQEQMFLAQYLPAAGLSQLPVGQPPLESEKGKK